MTTCKIILTNVEYQYLTQVIKAIETLEQNGVIKHNEQSFIICQVHVILDSVVLHFWEYSNYKNTLTFNLPKN